MVLDYEHVARAAARTNEVVPSHLIGVTYARIPDRRHHVEARGRGENIGRQNGAAVAVGSRIDATDVGQRSMIQERERRADEVSGFVKALGALNFSGEVIPRDDEAAVGKGSHVVEALIPGLIEDVDENVAIDEVAIGIIDRCTNARAAAITRSIRPTHDESAVG